MKKIILSSIVLLIFSISIAVFQVSCQKDATANTDSITGVTQQNKIIYLKNNKEASTTEIWTANYDGSDQKKLNVDLSGMNPRRINISPDGQNIFIIVFLGVLGDKTDIYTCKTDGSNLKKIIDGSDLGYEGLNDIVSF